MVGGGFIYKLRGEGVLMRVRTSAAVLDRVCSGNTWSDSVAVWGQYISSVVDNISPGLAGIHNHSHSTYKQI